MLDIEKIMAFFKANSKSVFTVADVKRQSGVTCGLSNTKSILAALVEVGALDVQRVLGLANKYVFKADVAVIVPCKECNEPSEIHLIDGGLCGTCRRRGKRGHYTSKHLNRRARLNDNMRALLALPLDASKEDVKRIIEG